MSKIRCCICTHELENEFGNNPAPVVKTEGARCCNICNENFVIPARLGEDFSFEKKMKAKGEAIYTIDKLKEMYTEGSLKTGLYTSRNEDGCDILLGVQQGVGFDIHTNQENGWIRVDSYDYDVENNTWTQSESYEGKWK